MKYRYFLTRDLFKPALVLSISIHLLILGAGRLMPTPPQYAVVQAPSSIEVVIIEERSTMLLQAEVVKKVKIDLSEIVKPIMIDEPLPDIPEIMVEKFVPLDVEDQQVIEDVEEKEIFEEGKAEETSEPIYIEESQGAVWEAQPIESINPAPAYPRKARKNGWEGIVILMVQVEKTGAVRMIEVEESSGYRILDETALRTVERWHFTPAKAGNYHFTSSIKIPIEFKLID